MRYFCLSENEGETDNMTEQRRIDIMKIGVFRKKWKFFWVTVAVLFSVLYPKMQIWAQLDAQGAEKIHSDWEDHTHQFSSFDDENALKVEASYGFKLKTTDQTQTIVEKGKTTTTLPDIGIPASLRQYTWFRTSENTAGNMQVKKTNMEIYQCEADGSNGHWEKIDLVMTVSHIEKYQNQDGYVAIGNGISGCAYIGIEEMTMKSQFYKAGTQTPVIIKSNVTLQDIDTRQYIGVKADNIHGQYVSHNTKLSYKKSEGMNIYYADFDEDYDSQDFTCAGFTFTSDSFEYTFGRNLNRKPTNQEQYVGSGQNMVRFEPTDPKKYIIQSDNTRVERYQSKSLAETWTYEVEQAIAGEIPEAHYYKKFILKDQIEQCLKILDIKVFGDGYDVTEEFHIEKEGNQITAALKNPQSAEFYKRGIYTLKIQVKMDIPENPSQQQLNDLRKVWTEHGHYDITKTTLIEKNQAETVIDERVAPTNQVVTEIELPEEEKDVPGLKITKKAEKYEYQAKDVINYKVTVKNTNKNAETAYFTIQDISLPGKIDLDFDSIQISGIDKKDYTLAKEGNGWILKSKGDYALPWNQTIVISYKAKAEVSSNGTLADNKASVWAAGVPKKEADQQIYVNSPKINVTKTAPQKIYKQGDYIFYKVVCTNPNQGTFMRNVEFEDQLRTDGVHMVPGTLAVLAGRKDITKECEINYGKDGRSYTVKTPINLKNGEIPVMESEEGKKTGDYENLSFADEIQITYQAVIEKDGLEGNNILNILKAPATKNTNGEIIRDDEEIPSGGGKAQESVKVKSPALQMIKQSDKKIYSVGETGTYSLKVTQIKEDLTAKNVVISDQFEKKGMEISQIKVSFNKEDITKSCKIEDSKEGFHIETGKDLGENDLLEITYQVLFKEKIDGGIKNTAIAESDNTLEDQDENIVVVEKPVLNIKKTSDNSVYKEGETGTYELKVTQKNDGMTAHQIVVEDAFAREGMKISGICVKYNGKDITQECEIIMGDKENQFQIHTEKDLSEKDVLLVTYHVLFEKMLSGNVSNTAEAYGIDTEKCRDENTVTMETVIPKLSIFKSSSEKTFSNGDICNYEITVLQTVKGAIAKNVVIRDELSQKGAVIQRDTVKVYDFEGKDITDHCKIDVKERSYSIETGRNLAYDQKMKVTYQVKAENIKEKKLKNTVFARAENAKEVSVDHTIKRNDGQTVISPKDYTGHIPKTGENSWMPWMFLLTGAGACLVFFLGKRYNRKK